MKKALLILATIVITGCANNNSNNSTNKEVKTEVKTEVKEVAKTKKRRSLEDNNDEIRFKVMAEKMVKAEAMKGYSGYRYDTHFSTGVFEMANEYQYTFTLFYYTFNYRTDRNEKVKEDFQVIVTDNGDERNDVQMFRIYDDIK